MESSPGTSAAAAAELDAAEAARDRLVARLDVPHGFYVAIAAAIAVQIASAAIGISSQTGRGLLLLAAGGAVFALVAALEVARFRRRNGVWLAGLASRVAFGGATAASSVYVAAMGGAAWAAFAEAWWLVVVASVAGGAGYALCGRRWLRLYRADPEAHGRPDSTALLALVASGAVIGLLMLVIGR